MTKFERHILYEASSTFHWWSAKVRPVCIPNLSMSACIDILRVAAEMGHPDLREEEAFEKFLKEK